LGAPEKISADKLKEIELLSNTIYISSITVAEIMIKSSLGKIKIDFDPVQMIESCGFEMLDFSVADAVQLKELPFFHKDPFDRMLIAQSLENNYFIMSDDGKFKFYDCKLI
jgi:PIN domain nuclease of toxin-antitoxin system